MVFKAKIFNKSKAAVFLTFVLLVIFSLNLLACSTNNNLPEKSLEELFNKVSPSVATLAASDDAGTAFVVKVDGNNVYLATNKHIFETKSGNIGVSAKVTFLNNKSYDGTLLGFSDYHDIAVIVIKKETADIFTPLKLSGNKNLNAGQKNFLIGNAFNLGLSLFNGIISMPVQSLDSDSSKRVPVIQVSTPINGGSSGSPVCDYDGKVIGVATYQIPPREDRYAEAMNFCVPSVIAEKIVNQVIKENPEGEHLPAKTKDLDIKFNKTGSNKYEIDFYALGFKGVLEDGYLRVTNDYDESSPTIVNRIKKDDKIYVFGNLETDKAGIFDLFNESLSYISDGLMPVGSTTSNKLSMQLIRENKKMEILYLNVYEKSY